MLDTTDNCPLVANTDQADVNGDGVGDACMAIGDIDGDGVIDPSDNCRDLANPQQEDTDSDGIGDVCDAGDPAGMPSGSGCGCATGEGSASSSAQLVGFVLVGLLCRRRRYL